MEHNDGGPPDRQGYHHSNQHHQHHQHHQPQHLQSSHSYSSHSSQSSQPSLYTGSLSTPATSMSNNTRPSASASTSSSLQRTSSINSSSSLNAFGGRTFSAHTSLPTQTPISYTSTSSQFPHQSSQSQPQSQQQLHSQSHSQNNFISTREEAADAATLNLVQKLFQNDFVNSQVLSFKAKAPKPTHFKNQMKVVYSHNKDTLNAPVRRQLRHINPTPERVLDAPGFSDDYYLNLLDWSSQNTVGIALGSAIYLWDPQSGSIENLLDLQDTAPDDSNTQVTSLKFMNDGTNIAVGTTDGATQIWNIENKKRIRTLQGHSARVSSLSWNSHILSTGSLDTNILHHDVRIKEHITDQMTDHEGEICGLQWNTEGTQLASGSNDNKCMIWNSGSTKPTHTFTNSEAAVKAIAWCPWQKNTLATGSGTADRKIRFYDTLSGTMTNEIDTQSQVCSLVWSTTEKEILSSHGFSQNQISVWKYPSLVKVADLTGHTSRVLQTAISPDGTTIASAAADETLRFWRVWESHEQKMARKRAEAQLHGFDTSTQGKTLMSNIVMR